MESAGINTAPTTGPRELLTRLVKDAGAITALLISKEGVSIAEAGDTSYLNTTALSALIGGMFSATREVARMVGEKHFSILLQQGDNRHLHISLLGEEVMLVVIFEDYQRIGRVRYEARKAGERISAVLSRRDARGELARSITPDQFKEYALNLIDRIFQQK